MNKAWWFWLLFSAPLWAEQYRDPFQPPLIAACSEPAVSPAGWRLKGIIGTPDLRYGWVVTPQGQWLGLLPRQRVLDGDWQVMQIQPWQLELAVQDRAEACQPRTSSVVLTLGKTVRKGDERISVAFGGVVGSPFDGYGERAAGEAGISGVP